MNIRHSRFSLLSLLLILLSACGGGSSTTDVPDVVLPPVSVTIDVEVTGNVTDVITGDAVNTATLTFLSNGTSTNEVRLLDTDFTRVSEITALFGAFSFGFDSNVAIDSVTILVEADGYLSQSINFDIANASASNTLVFPLVPETTSGLNVTELSETVDASGAVTSTVNLNANTPNGGATVSIPSGVVLQDAQNNPVTGAIDFQVVGIDSEAVDDESVGIASLLPPGLQDPTSTLLFTPVAATIVKLTDANGQAVKRFSSPITITMRVPSSRNVEEGDALALKSFDELTGVWTTEPQVLTVGARVDGFYPVTFQIDHLTMFAIGRQVRDDVCAAGTTTFNFTGDAAVAGLVANISRSVSGVTSTTLVNDQSTFVLNDTQSASETLTISVTDSQGRSWGRIEGATACGAVSVPLINPSATVTEDLNVTAVCAEDNTVFTRDTAAIVIYRLANSNDAFATATHEGG